MAKEITNKKEEETNYYLQALIAEYNAIRTASLSRDTMKKELENFMIILVSALIAGYSMIVQEDLYIIFPLVSILLSAITFTRHYQRVLLKKLSAYEELLQKKMIIFLEKTENLSDINTDYGIWGWQNYLKSSKPSYIVRLLRPGIATICSVLPFCVALIFPIHKNFCYLSITEMTILIIALLYSLSLIIYSCCIFFNSK